MAKDYKDTRFREAHATNCAEIVEAVINTLNEGFEAFEDRKITLAEILWKAGGLMDDWIAAGKDIGLVDDELKTIGWDTGLYYAMQDIDDGLVFPENMAKMERKVKAGINLAKAAIEFYFAMSYKEE